MDRDSKDADASCYSPDTWKPNDNSNIVMNPRLQRSGSFENVESKRGPRIEPSLEIFCAKLGFGGWLTIRGSSIVRLATDTMKMCCSNVEAWNPGIERKRSE